jgi:hypothetical protein
MNRQLQEFKERCEKLEKKCAVLLDRELTKQFDAIQLQYEGKKDIIDYICKNNELDKLLCEQKYKNCTKHCKEGGENVFYCEFCNEL